MGPPKKIANILRSLLVLTLIVVCCCEPQGSYYDRFGYSRSPADIRRSYAPNNRLPTNNNLFSSNNNRLPAINNNYNRYNTYRTPSATTTSNSYNSYRSPSAASTTSYSSYNRPRTTSSTIADRYSSKRYPSQDTKASSSSLSSSSNTASNADVENAKFAGVSNQEADDKPESGKTLLHIKRKYHRLRPYRNRNRCFPYGRDAVAAQKDVRRDGVTPPPQEQGRFLWDLNVYNVYPQGGPLYSPIPGCGGLGGGGLGLGGGGLGLGGGGLGLGGGGIFGDYIGGGNYGGYGGLGGGGGGLLSDPIAPSYQATTPLNNFLNLFAPGILQNALAATVPPLPPPQQDPVAASDDELSDLQNDPAVDPNYRPAPPPPPRRRPNRVYYDSAGAPAITPAQLVGGVATTVNGIIQQLTGNVQPVYQSSYRRSSYG